MSPGPSTSALLAHVVAQTQSNIDFLVSQNVIRASDAATILSKLESVDTESLANGNRTSLGHNLGAERARESRSPVSSIVNAMTGSSLGGREREETPARAPSPPKAVLPLRRVVPPQPSSATPSLPRAKALWDYNEHGVDPNDLSFRAGDEIEIISETNPDWWTGRLHGKQGLFPSNYVEKLPSAFSASSPARGPIPVPAPMVHTPSGGPNFPVAPPMSHANSYNSYHSPPPPPSWSPAPYGGGYNEKQQQMAYAPPPGPIQQAPPPPQQEPEKKKSKFGGLGTTMANSAAGGVGFGAGAAVGSGIINAIF